MAGPQQQTVQKLTMPESPERSERQQSAPQAPPPQTGAPTGRHSESRPSLPSNDPIQAIVREVAEQSPEQPKPTVRRAVRRNPLTGQPVWQVGWPGEKWEDQQARIEQNAELVGEWAGLTAQQKTQLCADLQFQGRHRFRVGLPTDKAQVTVEINADSPEEAAFRYNRLCGIRHTEHQHAIEQVASVQHAAVA